MSMGQFQSLKSAWYLKNGFTEEGTDPNAMTLDKLDDLEAAIEKAHQDGTKTR